MSWDAVILRIRGPIRPVAEVAESDYMPLGGVDSVADAIRSAFPSAKWDCPTHAAYVLDKFTGILFDLEGVESSNCVLVSVSGSADPIPALLGLANPNGWVLLDVQNSEFIDPETPSRVGWNGYRSLLERASGGMGEAVKHE